MSSSNVTTPAQSFAYWNTLQHRRSAAEVLDISLMLARRAMARAGQRLNRDIPVMAYADLAARVKSSDVSKIARDVAAIPGLDGLFGTPDDLPTLVTATAGGGNYSFKDRKSVV